MVSIVLGPAIVHRELLAYAATNSIASLYSAIIVLSDD